MKKALLIFGMTLIMLATVANAQTPAIRSISPNSGAVGSSVTITGSGFAATGNIVIFENGTTNAAWVSQINASSADGYTIVFSVPSTMNPYCYYTVPACASPSTMTTNGVYYVCVKVSSVSSNALQYTVTGTPSPYSLTISVQGSLPNVTVTVDPPGITSLYPITTTYNFPTMVSITANNYTYPGGQSFLVFTGWSGDTSGTYNNVSVNVDGAKNVSAMYAYGDIVPTPEPTPEPTPVPTPDPTTPGCPFALGDANGSGSIDIVDALVVAQYYVGLAPSSLLSCAADTNRDGKVDIVDALRIAQCYVGVIICNF